MSMRTSIRIRTNEHSHEHSHSHEHEHSAMERRPLACAQALARARSIASMITPHPHRGLKEIRQIIQRRRHQPVGKRSGHQDL